MMPWFLALVLLQPPVTLSGVVTDGTGATVPAALVTVTAGTVRRVTTTGADGMFTITLPAGTATVSVRAEAPGFGAADRDVTLPAPGPLAIALEPQRIAQEVTVTGETSLTRLAIESSVTSIDRRAIAAAPALRLDDQLRSVPGFSLFRRSSSAVANPTTQGVTLRGLSASGASRTLVVADDVPLNDAFGGWVYWDRIPMVSLQRIDVMRGASGDIHGNDALGGVIRLATRTGRGAEAWLEGGSNGTARASGYGGLTSGPLSGGGAIERAITDGYRVVAPEVRGTIDVPADSRSTAAIGWIGGARPSLHATLRGGYFNENRGNGTPGQLNGTITRWAGANASGTALGGVWEARGDATFTGYRQTFSAVLAGRASERLTSLQWVGSSAGGAGVTWLRQSARTQALFGVSSRIAKARLDEASISIAGVQGPVVRTRALQRGDGILAQGRVEATPRVTLDAGVRVDYWRLSNRENPEFSLRKLWFFEPRVGASFQLAADRVLRVSWLTGFRTPTMNELYRAFRVGNAQTRANDRLDPEESWGPEVAFTMRRDRFTGRAIFYATRLTGAVYNRTLVSTPTGIVRERSNGQARAIGSEVELEWRARRGLALTTAWAFNESRFTEGELEGKRIPQVPRASGSFGVRAERGRWLAAGTVRVIGAQFDDDRNDFRLAPGSLSDARVAWRWSRRLELFGAVENLFDEDIDTGRTPLRTIGSPRIARAGVMVRF